MADECHGALDLPTESLDFTHGFSWTLHRGHWFVIHGFAKNVQANIDAQQLADLKVLSKALLSYDDLTVERAVGIGVIRPITEGQGK